MSTLTFNILGKGSKTITVEANIDGHLVRYFGVNKEVYLKRMKTYQAPSRRYQLLSWLRKNSTHIDPPNTPKAPVKSKKTPLPQTVRPLAKAAPKSAPAFPISLGAMVAEVERQLVAKGYTLVKKGKSTPMTTCSLITKNGNGKFVEHGCGKKSMIGAFKETPDAKFIGVCYNRYNIKSSCEVVKVWDKEKARTWLDKQKAA